MEIIEHGKTYKRILCTNCRCVFATCKGECKMHDLSGKATCTMSRMRKVNRF